MFRPNISNRAFDRMGERYAPLIDRKHFLGRSAFDIPWEKERSRPAANIIKKNGKIFELQLAVPGFKKEEIEILLRDDVLTVRGEKSKSEILKESKFLLEEFDFETFERSFKLAASVAHEKITAKYDNGILKLTFFDVPVDEEIAFQKIKIE